MKVGDTVRVIQSKAIGMIVSPVDYQVDNVPRWVVHLASTMREHIFQQKDLEIISTYYPDTEGGVQ